MSTCARLVVSAFALLILSSSAVAFGQDEAVQKTKAQVCKGGLTVERTLEQSIRSHSQRDLGWRTFPGNGYIDVERAVLINKGMEIRYRWRVEQQGTVGPENERAEKLCEEE